MTNSPIVWLKEIRRCKKLTTYQVAKLAGFSQSHYAMIESGNRSVSVKKAKTIASVLGFDWTRFYQDDYEAYIKNMQPVSARLDCAYASDFRNYPKDTSPSRDCSLDVPS